MALDITQYPVVLDTVLERFEAEMPFYASISNQYGAGIAGRKKGEEVLIELEPKYLSTDGFGFNPQTIKRETAPVIVDTEKTVAVDLSAIDLTLNFDNFEANVAVPAAKALSRDVENKLNDEYKNVSHTVGTAGTLPTTFDHFMEPIQELTRLGLDASSLTMLLGPDEKTKILAYMSGLNNPDMVNKAVRKAFIGMFGGVRVLENLFRKIHTAGTGASYATNGANQGGDGNIIVKTGTGTFNVGDVITIADTKSWNYATTQTTNILKDHVIDTLYTPGGAGTISVAENLLADSTNAYRNVDVLAGDSKAVTLTATHKVNLCYAKRAFGAAIVPLAPIDSAPMRVTRSYNGISMTLSTDYSFTDESEGSKLMILFGTATTDRTAAIRLAA